MTTLKSFNKLRNANLLRPGMKITVPELTNENPRKVAATTAKNSKLHRVQHGDTLWSIARKYGISVVKLRDWNNRNDNTIRVGESLALR
jgi:membrane-bound lytic murein transglycosylase D